jgi:hypothetical protein
MRTQEIIITSKFSMKGRCSEIDWLVSFFSFTVPVRTPVVIRFDCQRQQKNLLANTCLH